MKKMYIYWLHLAEHTDLRTQGYIGISCDPESRFRAHKSNAKKGIHESPLLQNVLNKYGDKVRMSVLLYNSEDYCMEKEVALRPTDHIGWNICPGGGRPPLLEGDNHPSRRMRDVWSKAKMGAKNGNYANPKAGSHLRKRGQCSVCGRVMEIGNLARYHNEKCKEKL